MLLLPKTPPSTYLKIKKFKGPKVDHFFHNKLIYREILFEKATYTGHVAHKKNKLFYREILLEKATYTGHVAHKKKQVNFK